MNITFFIGNGFDIGLGLKTRYEDFYKEYCDAQDTDTKNITEFKKTLKKWNADKENTVIDWADFEKAFGQHAKDFLIKPNDYLERFEHFVSAFNVYLEKEEKNIEYSDQNRIAKAMNEAVTTYFHIRNEDQQALRNLYSTIGGNSVYNFVSFNYTRTVDMCAGILKNYIKNNNSRDVGSVLHIHGYIDENMIMGVNDSSQIENTLLANDETVVREIVKPIQNKDIKSNYETQVKKVIDSSNIICIYGMSIGETDKKWWEYIADWLSKSEKHALVILKYDRKYNKRFPFSQRKIIDTVMDNFLSLSGLNNNLMDKVRSRIYIGMNHNVFEMNLRKENSNDDSNQVEKISDVEDPELFIAINT